MDAAARLPKNKHNDCATSNVRKRQYSDDNTSNYTFIKKTSTGSKIIRIEIHDAKNFLNREDTLCKCEAEICAQHVVKHIMFDDIYKSAIDLIEKIRSNFDYSP